MRITAGQTNTVIESGLQDENGDEVSLTGATNLYVRFIQPDGSNVKKTGSLVANKIRYVDNEDYLTQKGNWFATVGATKSAGIIESYQFIPFTVE